MCTSICTYIHTHTHKEIGTIRCVLGHGLHKGSYMSSLRKGFHTFFGVRVGLRCWAIGSIGQQLTHEARD